MPDGRRIHKFVWVYKEMRDGTAKSRLKHLTRADTTELSDDCNVLRMHALKGKALSGKHARLTIGGGGA